MPFTPLVGAGTDTDIVPDVPSAAQVTAAEPALGPAPSLPATTRAPGVTLPAGMSPDPVIRAGASVGLLPFQADVTAATQHAGIAIASDPISGLAAVTAPPVQVAPDGSRVRKPIPGGSGAPKAPRAPVGPPGSAGAGGVAAAFGGAAGGMWCAILLSFCFFTSVELRRFHCRLVLAGPAGIGFPLRRPG